MKPYYQDLHNTLYCMDFRKNDLPDACVQMVCTSPPYWGLRKYSGEQELIWGDNHCEHQWGEELLIDKQGNWDTWKATDGKSEDRFSRKKADGGSSQGQFCSLCGAWKGAYGLEPTPEMYVQHTIEILREIRRVLRKDGVVFWNIGDSYQGGLRKYEPPQSIGGHAYDEQYTAPHRNIKHNTIKPKDLCLIPFRIAISAQTDGWWVRSVIIWSKPNPMPESVTDRPTESHEYILMLTKSARYYWDADAVREAYSPIERWGGPVMKPSDNHKWAGDASDRVRLVQPKKPQAWDYADQTGGVLKNIKGNFSERGVTRTTEGLNLKTAEEKLHPAGRNIRTVWEFPTQPYPEAHFAVFPEKLPELCIKAATPEVGCCSKCGAPWERILEVSGETPRDRLNKQGMAEYGKAQNGNPQGLDHLGGHKITRETKTLGWQPTCKCNAEKIPSIVLDPFAGAGTTLWVAKKLNRQAVGYEISEEYCRLTVERIRQQVLL